MSDAEFDAYLAGTLHYLSTLRTIMRGAQIEAPRRAAAASALLLCAI